VRFLDHRAAPGGEGWLHEIKFDGYRMHARIDEGQAKLLTRTGLDWSHRYSRTIRALQALKAESAYIDRELCALNSDGVPAFSRLQPAMDAGHTDQLIFFAFELLFLNGKSTAQPPLIERKARLQGLFRKEIDGLRYTDHVASDGPRFARRPADSGSRAPSPSVPTELMRQATAGSGSSRSASTVRSSCRRFDRP
jgi:ATP-dependent DNA ligase